MLIRGKAPLRLSFCGGGSDVSPYCDTNGGCVLSTTIAMHAMGSLQVRADNQVSIFSVDYDELVRYELQSEINDGDKLSFLRAVIKRLNPPSGLNLYMHCDAPPGTGLGSSGTISALIVGLINHAFNLMLTKYDMARIAYQVEHDDLGRAVGRQDHYAAVFGGMNFMEFGAAEPVVYPLRVEPWIMEELGYHLQMFYTRKKRDSTDIVATQVKFYEEKRPETMDALAEMKTLAREMQRALVLGQAQALRAAAARRVARQAAHEPGHGQPVSVGDLRGRAQARRARRQGAGRGRRRLLHLLHAVHAEGRRHACAVRDGRATDAAGVRARGHPHLAGLRAGPERGDVGEALLMTDARDDQPAAGLDPGGRAGHAPARGAARSRQGAGADRQPAFFGSAARAAARAAGFEDVVMLLGARHEGVVEFIAAQAPARADEPPPLRIRVSIESSPLGTGGAVKNAEALATEPFFLLNGDTYVDFDAAPLIVAPASRDRRRGDAGGHPAR